MPTVNVQDFIDAVKTADAHAYFKESSAIFDDDAEHDTVIIDGEFDKKKLTEAFDDLLSRARQEARREALKEMDEAHVQSESSVGLAPDMLMVEKLRKEYSNQQ